MCAGIVLAGTDLGGAQRRLAASFANLAAEIAGRFTRMLALAGPQLPDTQTERREFVRRVIALDPMIDQTLGESSHVRYHSLTLQTAVHGLFRALDGWRGVATHLSRLPDDMDRQAQTILRSIPPELRSAREPGAPARWMADPMALRRACEEAIADAARPAGRHAIAAAARRRDRQGAGRHVARARRAGAARRCSRRPPPGHRGFRLTVPDWLPALVNAARAFVAIGAVELFWVATAWPNGASAIVFVAIVVLLLSPRGDLAYGGAIAFAIGTAAAVVCAAIIKFAVLPAFETFPAFCVAIGLFLIPVGFAMARGRQPAAMAVFTAMAFNFMPLLAPTNPMSYDTAQFYNSALAIVAGCGIAALAFRLLPPLSPALRTRRLLALTLARPAPPRHPAPAADIGGLGRPHVRPAGGIAGPGRAVAARAIAGGAVGRHRDHPASPHGSAPWGGRGARRRARGLRAGNSAIAIARLRQLDRRLASDPDAGPETATALRARGRILVISEALSEHASYFDAGAPA